MIALASAGSLGACSADDAASEPETATGAAVSACLRGGSEQFDFPADEADTLTVTVERDDDGAWAVQATTGGASVDAVTLTCTAVADAVNGARAASWSVAPAS